MNVWVWILVYLVSAIIGAGLTVGTVAGIGASKKAKGESTCHRNASNCNEKEADGGCNWINHQRYPHTVNHVLEYQGGYVALGLLWPAVLAVALVYGVIYSCVMLPVKYLFLGAASLSNWGYKEVASPRTNVRE